jgi:uncharacterized phage infection (PIP) family protein YhgE
VTGIPHNFTAGLISMSSTTPQKPVITYKVNEKLNAIASKIANAALNKCNVSKTLQMQTRLFPTIPSKQYNP